ncbi:hypothetical protein OESDEN_02812 [Oesophagostomum dentatum]|uniref:Dynein heavy chain tail domain-containing protein n=1 Tax=Oesophagostomum dentatum TaxID=61180 RepID=A0A0B1TI60_OESDE|nr:hypothetical protein OESDEN_02812 [Oesophagostomum dentatum]
MRCSASFLCEKAAAKIGAEHLWKNTDTVEKLSAAIGACSQWEISVQLMTGQTWRRQMDGAWKGEAVEMKYLQGFRKRLEEVEIRSLKLLGPQIALLLNDRAVQGEVETTIEAAMRNTSALEYNPLTEHTWTSRVSVKVIYRLEIAAAECFLQMAEKALDSIIDRTVPVLKSRLQLNKLESNHLTADLEKYKNFLCRTKIKEKLQAERETLLTQLSGKILEKERDTDNRMNNYTEQGRFLTEIAAKVVWIRQQTIKLERMQSLCATLLDDLSGYHMLENRMKSFAEKLKLAEQECYDQWCRETIQAIDDPSDSIALETKGKIMVLEQKRGTLNVNYSDRLLKLLKEVRQLASLGLNIPSKIVNCVNQAEKFYSYGVVLKQIAHFYNTIDQQMLPCQQLSKFIVQALLLDEAIAFEKLVIPRKNEESDISRVTWEDPKQLEEFIAKLQGASNKLSNHNRRLRNAHTEIAHMVLELVNLDVLKEVNKWKEILVKIRSKALQLQYQWGIESLHSQIPLIHTQLVFVSHTITLKRDINFFSQQKLQLRPPIEEIRAKYYKEMRKLLSIPEKFKGVVEGEQDWLVLAQVDLEQLIEEKLSTAADWEAQMKLLKTKGREAEKLPNEIRLECIVVSTAGAKSAIEELLQRLFDTLTWTLRLSITTKLHTIQQFLTQLKASWAVLNEQHTLLRSVAGSGVDQMSSLTQEWEKFETMLDSHQQMIKEQVEVLKLNVDTRVKALVDESEKLFARWNQFKPKSDALQGDRQSLLKAIEFIKEKRAEYDGLVVQKEKLE